jgi:hypothetical protein
MAGRSPRSGPMPSSRRSPGERRSSATVSSTRGRSVTDRTLWTELGAPLSGRSPPKLTMIQGSERLLRTLCGKDLQYPAFSLIARAPRIDCEIGTVQSGLGIQLLRDDLASGSPGRSTQQIRELRTAWHDAISLVGAPILLAPDCSRRTGLPSVNVPRTTPLARARHLPSPQRLPDRTPTERPTRSRGTHVLHLRTSNSW